MDLHTDDPDRTKLEQIAQINLKSQVLHAGQALYSKWKW